ncbi:hypothetical protein BDV11DRAFT_146548 [Aspergillus similis]
MACHEQGWIEATVMAGFAQHSAHGCDRFKNDRRSMLPSSGVPSSDVVQTPADRLSCTQIPDLLAGVNSRSGSTVRMLFPAVGSTNCGGGGRRLCKICINSPAR